jgi:hypothetical protein
MSNCSCDKCPARRAAPAGNGSRRFRFRLPLAVWLFLVVAIGVLVLDFMDARAEVYHSRESALELAFPAADSVTAKTLTLSPEEAARATDLARAELPSRLVQVYEAWSGGAVSARGIIDTHRVRSLPETLFVVADPENRVKAVHLLAFHEPVQYRGPERWLGQFADRELDPGLALRRDIVGIAGATMTSNAVCAAVRRCLATLQVGFGAEPGPVGVGK